MRTTIITCIATVLFSFQAFAAQNTESLTVELPQGESMDKIVQDVSGYLAMQGSSIKLDRQGKNLNGIRIDGIRFAVLFKKDSSHATVQCQPELKSKSHLPSQKHKLNGRRFTKDTGKEVRECTQSLALSVKRALR